MCAPLCSLPTSRLSIPRDALTVRADEVGADEVGAAEVNDADGHVAYIPLDGHFDKNDFHTRSEVGSEAGSDVKSQTPTRSPPFSSSTASQLYCPNQTTHTSKLRVLALILHFRVPSLSWEGDWCEALWVEGGRGGE